MKILRFASVFGLISLFFLFISGCGTEDTVTETKTVEKVSEKIRMQKKKEVVNTYDFNGKDSILAETVTDKFDSIGNLTFELIQDGTGTTIGSQRFVYNEKGKLTESVYMNAPVYMETTKVIYDAKGDPLEETREVEHDHLLRLKLVTVYKDGKPAEKTQYDGNGKKNWHDVFSWSDNFKKLEKKGYDGNGKLLFTSKYIYNDKGDELAYEQKKDNRIIKKISEYTNEGKILSITHYKNDSVAGVQNYTYDNQGNRIGYSETEKGVVKVAYKYYHNENGDEVIMERFDDKNILIRKVFFSYEYYEPNP